MLRKPRHVRSMSLLAAGLMMLGGFSVGHGAETGGAKTAAGFREIRDMTSRTVRIPVAPSNILSLCTSATDTLVAMKAGARLAAIDEYGRVVPGTAGVPAIGKGSAISREEVIARRIDLAFVWWYQDDAARQLTQVGVPVVRMRSGRAAEVPGMIRLVGECLNQRDSADTLARAIEAYLRVPSSPSSARRPRVYLELYGPFKTSGNGTYVNDLIERAGGTNVAAEATGSVILSQEHLLQANPDVVLFAGGRSDASDIRHRGGLSGLDAVKAGRVYPVDRYWLVAGPNLPQAVEKLRALLCAAGKEQRKTNGLP